MKTSYSIVSVSHNRKLNALVLFRLLILFLLIVIIGLSCTGTAHAQDKLIISKKGEFKLDKDTLVVDEIDNR